MKYNKLDLENGHYGSAKQGLGGIQEDNKVDGDVLRMQNGVWIETY